MPTKESLKNLIINYMEDNLLDKNTNIFFSYETIIPELIDIFGQREVILEIFIDKLKEKIPVKNFIDTFIEEDLFTPREILPHFFNGNLTIKDFDFIELNYFYNKTGNKKFLKLIFDQYEIENRVDVANMLVFMFRTILKNNKILNDDEIIKKFTELLYKSSPEGIEKFLKSMEKFFIQNSITPNTIPDKLFNIIESRISEFSFMLQVYIWNHTSRISNLFSKIKDKDYMIIGSFHYFNDNKIVMVKDKKTDLYGYVDEDEKIVVPLIFDILSGISQKGTIMGKINQLNSVNAIRTMIEDKGGSVGTIDI